LNQQSAIIFREQFFILKRCIAGEQNEAVIEEIITFEERLVGALW
jgi:hypothetical protein